MPENLNYIDWGIIALYFALSLIVGLWSSKKASESSTEFFLSGRGMPWWLLGFSMVATTFSIDTPNLISDIVRQNGVAGNWVWWAFLLTGMLTVFIYSKLWRRSQVMTDIEFYELRYSGKGAAFLRGFRAIYLGVFFNVTIMASVTLAAIKVGGIMLGLSPLQVILIAGGITVIYSSLGGLMGVLLTDFVQFIIAMIGAVIAAYISLDHVKVGGLQNLLSNEAIKGKLSFLPDFNNWEAALMVFIIPIAIQWWSVWYPGAEPGGGGYIAQRMLAAKDEKHAMGATLFFNFAHYALRPWPWIIVALCSILVFPTLADIQKAFPHVDPSIIGHDMAYPAMLTYLPNGILGIVIASLIAAYMSTMSTSLNWGASYIVNDFYKRFLKPEASEKELVRIGRYSILVMMILASSFALFLESALHGFNVLLQIGAGTGLLFILRWFWYRINPASEITAMIVSFIIAIVFLFVKTFNTYQQLIIGVMITTIAWIVITIITKPSDMNTLVKFYKLVRPGRIGWSKVIAYARENGITISGEEQRSVLPLGIIGMLIGCIAVYSFLFAIGYWVYMQILPAILLTISAAIFSILLFVVWNKINQTK